MKIPDLHNEDITLLEKEMDHMNENLPELKHFILPGGNTIVSYCHVARCICRRAERLTVQLATSSFVDEKMTVYLKRLGDYLFVLARKLNMDAGTQENIWLPRL